MKIIIHDYSGHPFQVQLSRELVARGNNVYHLYANFLQTPRGSLEKKDKDSSFFHIEGIGISQSFTKFSFFKRRSQEIEYGHNLARKIEIISPDVLISSNTPLDPQSIILKKCKSLGIRFIFWIQDLYGSAVYRILRKKFSLLGELIGRYYINLEYKLLKKSDGIIVISDDFIPKLEKNNIDVNKIHFIPNWAPLNEIYPLPKKNIWSRKNKLNEKLCILYTGTLGMKHNPGLIFELAQHLKNNNDIKIIVASEGPGVNWLMERKKLNNLDNLSIIGFQPFDLLSEILASGDILLAILENEAGVFSVPSKILSYMAAGRAIVAALPSENLASRLIVQNKAGLVSSPDKPKELIKNVELLLNDDNLRNEFNKNAIKYAKKTFDIKKIGDKFESIIK